MVTFRLDSDLHTAYILIVLVCDLLPLLFCPSSFIFAETGTDIMLMFRHSIIS